MSTDLYGLEGASERIRDLARTIEQLEGEHKIPLQDLLDRDFMSEYTEFESIYELFEHVGEEVENHEDLESIPKPDLDVVAKKYTTFSSWEEMVQVAGREWVSSQLGP